MENQVPSNSLVAAAKRLTTKNITRGTAKATTKPWQEDAWEMYDLVGEQRFLATTLAGRLSQARLYVGEVAESDLEVPIETENTEVRGILDAVGGGPSGRKQLIARLAINLFVAGDGWLVGVPKYLMPFYERGKDEQPVSKGVGDELNIDDLSWHMLSVSEVRFSSGEEVLLIFGEAPEERVMVRPDNVWLVRVWRPHPRKAWEADSPTRSSLPVLRELVGLTMHISAQVDSRLAGAGLLVVPQSAQRALNIAAGLEEDDDSDPFTEALMEAMIEPINNRASASALVPLVVTVPDEVTGSFEFITFSKSLDTEARNLRDEAIRRLALGQDAPPELLLGTAGMNHWGAWLVREDVVTTHIEPPLALICDALTTQYLWPVLEAQGMVEEEYSKYIVSYDVSKMVVRPNRAGDAASLHDKGVVSDATLRNATGFDDGDAPETPDEVSQAIFTMVQVNPELLTTPGVNVLRKQLTAIVEGSDIDPPEAVAAAPEQSAEETPAVAAESGQEPIKIKTKPKPSAPSDVGGPPVSATSGPPSPDAAPEPGDGA